MADAASPNLVLDALLRGLARQGQGGTVGSRLRDARSFPVEGTIDLVALAEEVESALGGATSIDEEAKSPADLNAANDG